MQSRLPDINTAFIKHRNTAMESLNSQRWDTVFGSLYSWNALLPRTMTDDGLKTKYRIVISDIEFAKVTKIETKAICGNCQEQTDYDKIRIFDLINPMMIQILADSKTTQVWVCSKCHKDNKLPDTAITETTPQEPVYLGVVPKPPTRKDGLHDRGRYARKVTQWAWRMISELEERTGQFREDYKENKEEFTDWSDDDTDGHLEAGDS